jgi:glycosyltransferase involved in cell wall biosynthesis
MSSALLPLKVLFLTTPAKSGGALAAQTFIEEEIRAIRQFNVAPYVVTDEIAGETTVEGVPVIGLPRRGVASTTGPAWLGVHHLPLLNRLRRAASHPREIFHMLRIEDAAARVIARERIDVVHSHFGWPAGTGGSLAARATHTPLVTSLRGTDVLMRPDLGYGLRLDPAYDVGLKHLFQTASRILVATAFMRAAATDAGAPPERVVTIDKGVDIARFRPAADRQALKRRLGVAGGLVLAVGGLQRRKGFETIIDAFAALGRPDTTLVICGTGSEQGALESRAAARGVAAQVRFEGLVPRDRIGDYFAASDVFVHAAELEAAGNVVLEALASGAVAVVTDSGGPGEYVQDGVNGFVIPVGDDGALTLRLEALLSNRALRDKLASAARQGVEDRHPYPRMIGEIRALYDAVRGARATPAPAMAAANQGIATSRR